MILRSGRDVSRPAPAMPEMILCPVCMEVRDTVCFGIAECGHALCYKCIATMMRACVATGAPVRCPLCRANMLEGNQLWALQSQRQYTANARRFLQRLHYK